MDGFRDGPSNMPNMGGNPMANQAMKMAMSNPEMISGLFENEMALSHAYLAAVYEKKHIEAIRDLEQAADIEDPIEIPDPEDRAEQLLTAFQSLITGSVKRQYLIDVVGIDEEKADTATTYINPDEEEWNETTEEWVEMWRDQGADGTDRELIDKTIRDNFGVPASRFRKKVLHMPERADAAMELIAGPSHGTTRRINEVREEVEHLKERIKYSDDA